MFLGRYYLHALHFYSWVNKIVKNTYCFLLASAALSSCDKALNKKTHNQLKQQNEEICWKRQKKIQMVTVTTSSFKEMFISTVSYRNLGQRCGLCCVCNSPQGQGHCKTNVKAIPTIPVPKVTTTISLIFTTWSLNYTCYTNLCLMRCIHCFTQDSLAIH